jgi:hypothetical protein
MKETYSLKNHLQDRKLFEFFLKSKEAELVHHCVKTDQYVYYFPNIALSLSSGSYYQGRKIIFFGDNLEKITEARLKIESGAKIELKKLEES